MLSEYSGSQALSAMEMAGYNKNNAGKNKARLSVKKLKVFCCVAMSVCLRCGNNTMLIWQRKRIKKVAMDNENDTIENVSISHPQSTKKRTTPRINELTKLATINLKPGIIALRKARRANCAFRP